MCDWNHCTFLALIFPRPFSNLPSSCLRSLWFIVAILSPIRALKHACINRWASSPDGKKNLARLIIHMCMIRCFCINAKPVGVLQVGDLLPQLSRLLLVVLQVCDLSSFRNILYSCNWLYLLNKVIFPPLAFRKPQQWHCSVFSISNYCSIYDI
jgi:hypothetical protein